MSGHIASFSFSHAAPRVAAFTRTSLRAVVQGVAREIHRAGHVLASRNRLMEMDDRMLKDLGISRAQADFEANKAPWMG